MRTESAPLVEQTTQVAECIERLSKSSSKLRPGSTYRFQFNKDFKFNDARALVPYLKALGVTTCYASPILKARPGSVHGYDITDHNEINPEIGTEEEFRAFTDELKRNDMQLLLDIVPNHMGVGHGGNPWWQDVLESGQASQYADYFDIDWHPLKADLNNKVLIPVLGDQYGEELEQGRLPVQYEDGRFFVQYFDKRVPLDPKSYARIFGNFAELPTALREVLERFSALSPHTSNSLESTARRRQDIPQLREQLKAVLDQSQEARQAAERALKEINGTPGKARSFDRLHELLEVQPYRLAHWRVSGEEINYRRFFDINDLVGLRMEDPIVFAATHRLIRRLLADGTVSGLRIDHPDGLFNPTQYFTRVQMLYAASQCCGPRPIEPVAENGIEVEVQKTFGQYDWSNRRAPLYVLAEKILEPGEDLPASWPIAGTVGYDFANLVNGIFIERRNERTFTSLYHRLLGHAVDVGTLVYESKKLIMHSALASEVNVLTHMLDEISSSDRRARDFTRKVLRDAIREVIACFPVYRTYIDERGQISDRDREYIEEAVRCAKRRAENLAPSVFDFLRDILLLKRVDELPPVYGYRKQLYFTLKFQQLTGPVMAKGLEDTTCYAYNRLISVNEVGGSPGEFGIPVEEFHRGNLKRAEQWPHSMLATSTHDTKRSEDTRVRVDVLTEMPRPWAAQVMRARRTNRPKKTTLRDGRIAPDANEEYLLYQTLLAAWPLEMSGNQERAEFTNRIQQYMHKAIHEAKVNVSWVNQDTDYSKAVNEFIARILRPGTKTKPNMFLERLEQFVPKVQFFGAMNSLAQVALKITSPGVPDVYQGQELWDFSLVDPDNRRPVDFELRRRILDQFTVREREGRTGSEFMEELLREWRDGRVKFWTTMRALEFRREHPELFGTGFYLPLSARGPRAEHVVAFARIRNGEASITVVPRLAYTLMNGEERWPLGEAWENTVLELPSELGGTAFENVFTGERVDASDGHWLRLSDVFARYPVAVLARRS